MQVDRGAPLPDGADAADFVESGWTPAEIRAWVRERLVTFCEPSPVEPAAGPAQVELPPPPDEPPPPEVDHGGYVNGFPFKFLGHDHGTYYYQTAGGRQVLGIEGGRHARTHLLMLAPLEYWEGAFPGKMGVRWDAAANVLFRRSERAGIYDPFRVRGRGAWWDEGRVVLHLGDRLVVDGRERPIGGIESRHVYEAAAPMRLPSGRGLPAREAVRLIDLCELLPWERQIDARLLAGWCVVAPICGAMPWRPHVWVTGPAGSGKSWIYQHVLARCLGETAIKAASETTQAGLRQVLGMDALPVIFDEAEGETDHAARRIADVLALMRQSSSETDARIYKGTVSGDALAYAAHSCFAFSSIGVGLKVAADKSRVTVLQIRIDPRTTREERAARFADVIVPSQHALLTQEWIDGLHARTIRLIPTIRANARTFAQAGAEVLGTQRMGDQVGALLAGAYALHSGREISLDAARAWLRERDWSDQQGGDEERDEVACLRRILEHQVGLVGPGGRQDRCVAELVRAANRDVAIPGVHYEDAAEALGRVGLRVWRDHLYVSNNATGIARILAGTPWAANWKLTLSWLAGATASDPVRFGGGVRSRAVAIPLASLLDDGRPAEALAEVISPMSAG